MSTTAIFTCLGIFFLAEGFYAMSEIALVSASKERLRNLAAAGSRTAALAEQLLSRPERLLATTLIATNICLVSNSFAANEAAARLLGARRSAWALVILAPMILVFAEILPKTMGRRHADTLALVAAWPVRWAMLVLTPAVSLMGALSRVLVGRVRRPGLRIPFVTKEEIRAILRAERRAALDPDEAGLISRLLGMATARIREVMTPLPDVVALPADASTGEAVRKIQLHGYSRLPVFRERTDNIVGVVHAMDLLSAPEGRTGLKGLTRKPFYVPEAGRLDVLLDEFRRRGHELAIVVDEYGAASGIVTLEDVLEEMVGDILDEFDRPRRDLLQEEAEGSFLVEGKVRLTDLSERLSVPLPRGGYETVAGFMADRLQRIPRQGDTVEYQRLRFTVVEASQRRVRRILIEKPRERATPAPGPPET